MPKYINYLLHSITQSPGKKVLVENCTFDGTLKQIKRTILRSSWRLDSLSAEEESGIN